MIQQYQLSPGGIRSLSVSRNGKLHLACKGRREIRVLKAAYGDGRCRTPHAHCVLSQMCNGNKSCDIFVEQRKLDSPCTSRKAKLELQYECIRRPGLSFAWNMNLLSISVTIIWLHVIKLWPILVAFVEVTKTLLDQTLSDFQRREPSVWSTLSSASTSFSNTVESPMWTFQVSNPHFQWSLTCISWKDAPLQPTCLNLPLCHAEDPQVFFQSVIHSSEESLPC